MPEKLLPLIIPGCGGKQAAPFLLQLCGCCGGRKGLGEWEGAGGPGAWGGLGLADSARGLLLGRAGEHLKHPNLIGGRQKSV